METLSLESTLTVRRTSNAGKKSTTPLQKAVKTLEAKKAENVVTIKMPADAMADHFIICTATSNRHAATLAKELSDKLRKSKSPVLSIEGEGTDWTVVDCGDIVVHIMNEEARKLYNLEKLWNPAFNEE